MIGVDFQDERGELPRAYVVLDPVLALTTTDVDIQKFLIGKLSRYKALDGGVRRVDALPRSSTGKVIKNIFRDQAKQEILEEKMQTSTLEEVGKYFVSEVTNNPKKEIMVCETEVQSSTAETIALSAEDVTLGTVLPNTDEESVPESDLVSDADGSKRAIISFCSSQNRVKVPSKAIVEEKEVLKCKEKPE